MPNLKNAKKALKQSKNKADHNKVVKAEIGSLRVKFRKALTAKNVDAAKETARVIGKKLDKAHARKILKKNTVARYKSRMMSKLNALAK